MTNAMSTAMNRIALALPPSRGAAEIERDLVGIYVFSLMREIHGMSTDQSDGKRYAECSAEATSSASGAKLGPPEHCGVSRVCFRRIASISEANY